MRRVLVLLLVSVFLVAGCGSKSNSASNSGGSAISSTTPHTSFAKTKFVFHAGLAFGVFHRWIYKPFRRGDFNHPFLHKLAVLKAIAAALFVRHEVLLARQDARSSKLLSKAVIPLVTLTGALFLIKNALVRHHSDPAAMNQAESSVSSTKSASSAAGQPIQETTQGAPAGL